MIAHLHRWRGRYAAWLVALVTLTAAGAQVVRTARDSGFSRIPPAASPPFPADPAGPAGRVRVEALRELNYNPANAPWVEMWRRFDSGQIDRDLTAIARLGANAVRVVVPPLGVGWPDVTPTGAAEIKRVVSLAGRHHLSVQFTLFDWSAPYARYTDSVRWMKQAVGPFANDPRVALVEVKNEIDVDDPAAMLWARSMLAALPTILPGVPRTVSVAGEQSVAQLRRLMAEVGPLLDVVDVHLYGSEATLHRKVLAAVAVAGGRPVFAGEVGHDATDTLDSLAAQRQFFVYARRVMQDSDVAGFAVWTYTDINTTRYPQYLRNHLAHYGIRAIDGHWKPAAAIVWDMLHAR